MLGFEVIRDSNKTFARHFALDGKCLTMGSMIKLRHQQLSLWHSGLAEEIEDLWEPWMRLVDRLLEDEQLLDTIYVRFRSQKGNSDLELACEHLSG